MKSIAKSEADTVDKEITARQFFIRKRFIASMLKNALDICNDFLGQRIKIRESSH